MTYIFLEELASCTPDTMLNVIQQHIYDDVWILLVEGFNDKKAQHKGLQECYFECRHLYQNIQSYYLETGKIEPSLQMELNDFWHTLGSSLSIEEFKTLCHFFELDHTSLMRTS